MSTTQEEFPQRIKLLYMAKLASFTNKCRGNKGTHDLTLHPDKLRARACPRLRIQKPIEGHASFLLDAPEETQSHTHV